MGQVTTLATATIGCILGGGAAIYGTERMIGAAAGDDAQSRLLLGTGVSFICGAALALAPRGILKSHNRLPTGAFGSHALLGVTALGIGATAIGAVGFWGTLGAPAERRS